MTHNLRDQLLGLGFKPAPKVERTPERTPERKPEHKTERNPDPNRGGRRDGTSADHRPDARTARAGDKPGQRTPSPRPEPSTPGQGRRRPPVTSIQGRPRSREDIDLAKAYAIRAKREKDERLKAEQAKQEEARLRREARARLAELLKDKTLNAVDAEIARHFLYGGKIKRIHVTAPQLKALNAGELGVLQMDGRYVLVSAEVMVQAEAIFPPAVALKVDPDAPAADDPYADPQYQVPDDLVW
ncbi:MAG: DUF2058 family protein [Pseudomonadota bacterium]|nr:DUF2058 family protein [Pseudomonadota bacterium]